MRCRRAQQQRSAAPQRPGGAGRACCAGAGSRLSLARRRILACWLATLDADAALHHPLAARRAAYPSAPLGARRFLGPRGRRALLSALCSAPRQRTRHAAAERPRRRPAAGSRARVAQWKERARRRGVTHPARRCGSAAARAARRRRGRPLRRHHLSLSTTLHSPSLSAEVANRTYQSRARLPVPVRGRPGRALGARALACRGSGGLAPSPLVASSLRPCSRCSRSRIARALPLCTSGAITSFLQS